MKKNEKRILTVLSTIAGLILVRKAMAAHLPQKPRGRVEVGPAEVIELPPLAEDRKKQLLQLSALVDAAKAAVAFDEDVGAQRRADAAGLQALHGAAAMWQRLLPDDPPDLLSRLSAEQANRPLDNSLLNATAAVRRAVGYDESSFEPTKAPTGSQLTAARQAIALWSRYSPQAAETLNVLLSDALSLAAS